MIDITEGNENAQTDAQKGIPIDGFAQVVAMLEVADPAFRESLLRRIAQRDPRLAEQLRRSIITDN
jgi:hypothetical protein